MFHYLTDSLRHSNIARFLGVEEVINNREGWISNHKQHIRQWCRWFFEKDKRGCTQLIGDEETLTALDQVLEEPETIKSLLADETEIRNFVATPA